jgi:hypothetical protein
MKGIPARRNPLQFQSSTWPLISPSAGNSTQAWQPASFILLGQSPNDARMDQPLVRPATHFARLLHELPSRRLSPPEQNKHLDLQPLKPFVPCLRPMTPGCSSCTPETLHLSKTPPRRPITSPPRFRHRLPAGTPQWPRTRLCKNPPPARSAAPITTAQSTF